MIIKKLQYLTLVLGFISLLGCSNNSTTVRSDEELLLPSRFKIDDSQPSYTLMDEEGVVTWFVNVSYFPMQGSGSDLVSRKIFLDTKTQIHFKRGDDQQLQLLLASGDLPDIITIDKKNHFAQSIPPWAVPLNQLADRYDPYFYQIARKDSLLWYEQDDGNVYGYPNLSSTYDDFYGEGSVMIGGEAFVVRADIYQAIGSPDMRTPEGFLQALRDAKAYDPTVTPLVINKLSKGGAAVEVLLNFLAIPLMKEDRYYERIFDEEYIIWLDTLRQAHQEGLIIADNFSYGNEHIFEKINQGKIFCLLTSSLFTTQLSIIYNHHRDYEQRYIAIDGPANQNLDKATMYQYGLDGWTITYVTKRSKDKERVMQLITYLMSEEGHKTVTLGVEGESYYLDQDGLYRFTPEYVALRKSDPLRYQRETMIRELIWLEEGNWKMRHTDTLAPEMKQIFGWTQDKTTPSFAFDQTDPDPRSQEARTWKNYLEERNSTVVRMMRATNYDTMLMELTQLKKLYESGDVQRAIEIKNGKIAQNIKKLEKLGYPQE